LRTKMHLNSAPSQCLTNANPVIGNVHCSGLVAFRSHIAPVLLLTLFGCCSETPYETQGGPEENQHNLRTKMDTNPAEYRHIPEHHMLCSSNTMLFTTISSGVLAPSFGIRSRFVRDSFGFHWESPEETRTSPEQILDQSAMRSEAGSKKVQV
jgi:hypothetical protein